MRLLMLNLFGAVLLAACGSTPSPAPAVADIPSSAAMLQDLPPFSVDPRQCSMVLFTRETPARRIALGLDDPAIALAQIGGRTLQLPRIASTGAAMLGHSEQQTYAAQDGIVLVIDVRFEALAGPQPGAAIRSGVVSLTGASGATSITPVVGLLTCGAGASQR